MRTLTLDVGPGALSDYYDWFKDARVGHVLIYWRGSLAFDRDVENFRAEPDFAVREQRILSLDALATRIKSDADDGFLLLTQQRMGESDFVYRATRVQSPSELAMKSATHAKSER